ncbi:MAG: universal stress protein [Planctomycetota bacterium]|nr:universal stress protein [Planctomycetota bacterium]
MATRRASPPYATVLCPTDLSATGDSAVPVAYLLAAEGGRVHLMHISEPPYLGNPLYGVYVQGYVPTPEETKAGEERALARMHRLVPETAKARGVHTEFHVVQGVNVANTIEHELDRLACDIVVMGTHGRTGLGRILMGSVATDVVRKRGLPVIMVHADWPQPDEEEANPPASERLGQAFDRLASGLEGTGL